MNINVTGKIPQEEIDRHVKYCLEKYKDKHIKAIDISVDKNDPQYVDITVDFGKTPFERIRRITGYLVGSLERFNDAKRAEVEDRVKHM